MAFDPDRTPKQSGSYEIWSQACEEAIIRLTDWAGTKLTSPDKDIRDAARCADAIAQQFTTLLHQVEGWRDRVPTPESRTATINEIMRARELGQQLLQRSGATF